MSRSAGGRGWQPVVAVLGLFVASLVAPLGWYRYQQKYPRGREVDSPVTLPATAFAAAPVTPRAEQVVIRPASQRSAPASRLPADPSPSSIDQPADSPAADTILLVQTESDVPETPEIPADQREPSDRITRRPTGPELDLKKPIEPSPATQSLSETLDPGRIVPPDAEIDPALPQSLAWPLPVALIEQLDALVELSPQFASWAAQVKDQVERLAAISSFDDPQAAQILARLHELADQARTLAQRLPDDSARAELLRAGYAVVRRIAIWQQVQALPQAPGPLVAADFDHAALERTLAQIHEQLHATGVSANWRKYLLIDEAREKFDSSACAPQDQRQLARDMLHRLNSSQLSAAQERFLQSGPFAALEAHLYERAAETPDSAALLSAVEAYERSGLSSDAERLAGEYDRLRWSRDPETLALAEAVNSYYRNANVRLAVSVELINRLLPQRAATYESIRDMILGAEVEGDSHTSTKLQVQLIPDGNRWNLGLEAQGAVRSETASSKGPATFYQNGQSWFRARKRVQVDRRGIRLFGSEAAADTSSSLSDYETDFDGIPLLGSLARAIARNQYDSQKGAAKAEVQGRIIGRASSQLDREVAEKIETAKRKFQSQLIAPFQKLNLEPTAIDMETTRERLIARYRLAGRDQVSAHTPRPQAPSDSLLSIQLHESAINNVFDNLSLQGREIELHALYREISSRFTDKPPAVPEDLPEDVHVTFADRDPVRIDCQEGRVRITIQIHELSHGKKQKWTNFAVRGYYVPEIDELSASLVRDGVIELIGERLRFGDQIALRAIFGKVLSKNRKLSLIDGQIAKSPKLDDQQITQFTIHDGWMGIAIGPKRPGRLAALIPRPESETSQE